MSSVDNRIVQMQFNNKQFENGAKQTLGTLNKLKKSLDFSGVKTGIDTISRTINNGLKLDSVVSGVEALNKKFSSLGVAWQEVVRKITSKAISMGETIRKSLSTDAIMDGLNEYTLKMDNIQTILTNTASKGTTLDDVNEALNQLNKYADDTVYSFQDMTRAIGQFTTQGVDLETAVGAIKGFSNLAAGTGTSNTDLARAEYQMSQALSSGVVKLMDWKSMENAGGMGGEYFQKGLIESAKELGVELPEGLEEGLLSFRNSLSDDASSNSNWLTSDVLLRTLNKFAEDPTLKAAATEVKTFNQLIDTLKEALGTGWADSWEVIIGNFEEAKKLWTSVSNTLGDLINNAANARLELLKGWKSAGGRDALILALADAYKALLSAVNPVSKAMRELFPKITSDKLVDLTKKLGDFTKSLKLDERESFILYTASKNIGTALKQIVNVLRVMTSSVKGVFTASSRDVIFSLVDLIGKLAEKIRFSTETVGKLYAVAKGFFSLISIGLTIVKSIINVVAPSFSSVDGIASSLLSHLSTLGLKIASLDSYLKKTQIIQKSLENVSEKLKKVISKVEDLFGTITEKGKNAFDAIKKYGGSAIIGYVIKMAGNILSVFKTLSSTLFSKVFNVFKRIGSALSTTIDFSSTSKSMDALKKSFNNLKKSIEDNMGLMVVLKSIWSVFKSVISSVKSVITDLAKKVGSLMSSFSKEDAGFFIQMLGSLSVIRLLSKAAKAFETFGKTLSISTANLSSVIGGSITRLTTIATPLTTLTDTVKQFFSSLSESIDGFQKAAKIQSLKAIAVSVAILAASLLLLSLINVDKLWPALGALTSLIGELTGAMVGLTRLSGDKGVKQVTAISGAMVAMSVSVLILSAALKVLSKIDPNTLEHSAMTLTGLIGELVLVSRTLGTDTNGMIKGAAALILFSSAVKSLSKSLVILSNVDPKRLVSSLSGLMAIMTGLTLVMKYGKFDSMGIKSAIGIILFSKAVTILCKAVAELGQYDLKSIGKGLLGVGISLLALTSAIIALGKFSGDANYLSIGASMILISEAIKILSNSVSSLGGIQVEALGKGLLAVIVMLGAIVGSIIALEKFGGEGKLVSASLAMILMATSLKMLTDVVTALSGLDMSSLAKGLLAVIVMLGSLVGSMLVLSNFAGSGSIVLIAASMVIMTTALRSLSEVVMDLASLKLEELAKGIAGLAGMLVVVGGALLLMSKIANPASLLVTSAALVVAAVAVNMLATAMLVLSGLGLQGLVIALVALAGAFAVIGIAVVVLGPLVPVITLLSIAIAALGIGMLAAAGGMMLFVSALTAFAALGATAGEVIREFVGYLAEVIPQIAEAIAMGILKIAGVMANNTGELARMAIQMLVEVLTAIRDNIYQIVQLAADIIINFMDGLSSKLPELVDSAANLIVTFISSVADAVDEHGEDFLDAIWKLFKSLGKLGLKIIGKGKELLEKLWEGIKSIPLVDKVVDKVESAFDGIKDIWNKIKEIGGDLIDGLWNGIKEAAEGLIENVKGIGEDILGGVKDVLGIHSPSKEMAKLGVFTMEGFQQGLKTEGDKNKAMIKSYASDMYSAFNLATNRTYATPFTAMNACRPTVDLSNVIAGQAAISSLMSGDAISAKIRTAYGMDITSQISALDFGTSEIVNSIHELQNEIQTLSDTMSRTQIVMDSGAMVGQLAKPMNNEINRLNVFKRRHN